MRRSILVVLALLAAPASARAALDPVVEAKNYSKTLERQALYDSPPARTDAKCAGRRRVSTTNDGSFPPGEAGCVDAAQRTPAGFVKPAADAPMAKSGESLAYSAHGVDRAG